MGSVTPARFTFQAPGSVEAQYFDTAPMLTPTARWICRCFWPQSSLSLRISLSLRMIIRSVGIPSLLAKFAENATTLFTCATFSLYFHRRNFRLHYFGAS